MRGSVFAVLFTLIVTSACGVNPRMPAVDAGVHLSSLEEAEALLPILDTEHIEKAVLLGVLPQDQVRYFGKNRRASILDSNGEMLRVAKKYPDRFLPVPVIDESYQVDPQALIDNGARGILIEAKRGERLADRPEWDPLFALLSQKKLPLLLKAEFSQDLVVIQAIMLRHPDLTVLCASLCAATQTPNRLKPIFDKFPHFNVDMGLSDLPHPEQALLRVSGHLAEWRELILAHPDRFLFATRMSVGPKSFPDTWEILAEFKGYRRLLNDAHYDFPKWGRKWRKDGFRLPNDGALNGLFLPEEVLSKIYLDNSRRVFGIQ